MLFTDFDASDKGRPVAVFDEEAAPGRDIPQPVPQALQQTLEELAAGLGLSFEDDGETEARPAATATPVQSTPEPEPEPANPAATAAAEPAPLEDDQELLLGDADALLQRPDAFTAPGDAPSWDDLTSAYEHARPVEDLPPFLKPLLAPAAPAAAPRPPADSAAPETGPSDLIADAFHLTTPEAPPAPPAPDAIQADSGESLDVLSMLDTWLDHEQQQQPERLSSGAAGKRPPLAAPAIPYGGIERIADWFSPPENQIDPFARIEGWYAPPEEQTDPDPVLRMEDWFESPEPPEAAEPAGQPELSDIPETPATPEDDDPAATKVDISWLSGFQNELPEGNYWRKKTRRFEKKDAADAASAAREGSGGRELSPADTMTMFSAMDVDTLWDKRVAEKQQAQPAPESDGRGMSHVFGEVDVDSLLREKAGDGHTYRLPEGGVFPGPAKAEEAEKTIIVSPEELAAESARGAAGMVLLRDDLLEPKAPVFRAPRKAPQAEDAPAQTRARAKQDAPKAAAAPSAAPAPQAQREGSSPESPPEKQPAPPATARPSGAPAAALPGEDAAARAIGELTEQDALETLEALDSFGDADIPGEAGSDPTRAFDPVSPDPEGAVFGAGRDRFGEPNDQEYAPRTPPAAAQPKKAVTTDDLLNDVDLDSMAGEGEDIAPPFVDDSAIDAITPLRHPTEEMAAIAEQEGGEAPAPDSVAVNPMDVFANMDDMDFSDDVDDEMRALMAEEEEEGIDAGEVEAAKKAGGAQAGDGSAEAAAVPATRFGKASAAAGRVARRVLPMALIDKVSRMIAWRANWWFYCDLAAALVASASLAVIISYLFWYRGT